MQNQTLQAKAPSYRNAMSLASAILFAISGLYSLFSVTIQLINLITLLRRVSDWIPRDELIRILLTSGWSFLLTLAGVAIHALLACALIRARKNRFLVICVGSDVILRTVALIALIFNLVTVWISGNSVSFEILLSPIISMLYATGAILLFAVVLFHCTPKFANAKKWTHIVCFIPAGLLVICALIGWIQAFPSSESLAFATTFEEIFRVFAWCLRLPFSLAHPTAVLLLGIWVTFSVPRVKKDTNAQKSPDQAVAPQEAQSQKADVSSNPEHHSPVSIGIADELRKYKELLDAGAITQEEYEAVKTRLLKL